MLTLTTKIAQAEKVDDELVLPFELREKSRLRAKLVSGEDVAIFTTRGTVLRNGELLQGDDGRVIKIIAAPEHTFHVTCDDAQTLLRCAFHLGNRHTQVEIGTHGKAGFLRIRRDPVLRDMLTGLGAVVTEEEAPFEPEAGAYGGGHHHDGSHVPNLLAPIPLRQKIHRPDQLGGDRQT